MARNLSLSISLSVQLLTAEQKELQLRLLEVCHSLIGPNAIKCDAQTIYSRDNLKALPSL